MEQNVISLEELAHYAESTARTMPVTGVVPRTVAEDMVRYALRSLRESRRRLEAAPDDGAARWLSDNLWLCEQEGESARAAFHAAGRQRATREGALVPALCRVLLLCGGGSVDEERLAVFLEGFQRKTALSGRELSLLGASLRTAALTRLAQLYRAAEPDAAEAAVYFTALRQIAALELSGVTERADAVEQLLRRDPSGGYPLMDERSRQSYRTQVERLSRRRNKSERRVAEEALRLAERGEGVRRHIGYWLWERPLGAEPPHPSGGAYIAANLLLTLGLCALLGIWTGSAAAAALSLLPVSEIVKGALDRLILRCVPPRRLPRLELSGGVPDEGKTLCVLSVLLTGEATADAALRHLEEFRCASRDCGGNLLFGLLCDLPESGETLSHADRALLDAAAEKTAALNARCGGGFYLFTRERLYSRDCGRFAPWERKRGALLELCRLLAGENTGLRTLSGDASRLRGTAYILTLDADTRLEPGSARALIGAALHPLNRPAVEAKKRIVFRGHGVLHPRIAVSVEAAWRNDFTRLFAPDGGGDPYGSDAGEVYMDAFQSGGFAGKGLLHIGAFLACMDGRIPENRVLSHDAVEGAFLRGGYVSDVELTDGFPSGAASYFSRLHRWIRGDVQNLPFLFRAGKGLPAIERWRLFDSLRRALLPIGLLAALCAWFLAPGFGTLASALCALLVFLRPVLRYCAGVLFQNEREARHKSAALHGLGGELTRALARLLFLAAEAWTSASAVMLALWRMGVSRRKLLQWRTAEQSERGRGGLAAAFAALWESVFFAGLLLAFSRTVFGAAAAVCWISAPLFAHGLERERKAKPLDGGEREFLLRRAGEMWRYFRENCVPETQYLPPDNVQLSPPAAPAERTSPTNIAMTLASALAALELGIASEAEALTLCERILDTAGRLPKWKGHLYNWYDTRTLRPLAPAYISTVDSGNLAAALTACAVGLAEHGAPELAERARALAAAMDFRALYDDKRRLFRIGLLPGEEDAPAQSWYDLLESEERLTAYYTIASGQIEKRHWQRLSRAQTQYRRRRGMVSWSGSLFEYLMPEIFLPLYRGTHLWESARFAVFAQRHRTLGEKKLWGVSESAFYAFDATGHYRYKAHGCASLALCRGMDAELVLSPYSSYLALCAAPHAAIENLRRMTEAGLSGPYGLWEAVDGTASRTDGGTIPVRCVMTHHLGMSLCSAANALCGGVLCRWFMSDPAMAAYRGLLQERIPIGGALTHRRTEGAETRQRRRYSQPRGGESADALYPDAAALSNGAYRLLVTAAGLSRASCGTLIPYRSARMPWEDAPGIALWYEENGVRHALLPKPGEKTALRWRFSAGEAALAGECAGMYWEMRCTVSRTAPGERRSLTLRRKNPGTGFLCLGFEPVLLGEKDYAAHPAFARLGLCTSVKDGVLTVYRAPRGAQGAQYLSLACSAETEYSSDFRQFPTRGGRGKLRENTGWQNEPYVAARATLPESETCEIVFALCAASEEETSARNARAMLGERSGFAMADAAATVWGIDAAESAAASEYLRALVFPQPCAEGSAQRGTARDALWRHGISGDLPVAVFDGGEADAETVRREVRRHALLGACGAEYDLVFLTPDADYRGALRAAVEKALAELRLSETLTLPGGVYFAPRSDRKELLRCAALFGDASGMRLPETVPGRALRLPPACRAETDVPPAAYDENGGVSFQTPPLPPRMWANMLCGGELGCAAADAGTAALWYKNARECPVLPWSGDALSAVGAERLWAETPGGRESLFSDGGACRVSFGFGYARWERSIGAARVTVTAFLPPDAPVRVLLLETSAPLDISYFAPVQLAPEPSDASAASVWREGEALMAENPRCPYENVRAVLRCSAPWMATGTSTRFLCGESSGDICRAFPALAGSFRAAGDTVLLLGTADVPRLLDTAAARSALEKTRKWWARRVCGAADFTSAPESVRQLAPWCAYAALACRISGRGSLYQSGGAIGFRDQLQDRINLLPTDAAGTRAHILACCAHQYVPGDVQHWYHPGTGETDKGVRTACSDDLLWLPWAVCEYVKKTGDTALCREAVPYIDSPPLKAGERSRYETPVVSGESGTVLDHCHRAAALVLRRGIGAHRLLLIGGGDWNDAFDAMGGGAESVWLTWFASTVFHEFSLLLARLGEPGAERYETAAESLGTAANEAWDGDRYLRGYYADGTPLGASGAAACRIDSLSQSFAAFSPYADAGRVHTALGAALGALRDEKRRLVRLFAPPFLPESRSPGYVSTYGPGFRENGGQYTHAAVWLALALLRTGQRAEAAAIAEDIALSLRAPEYGAEPFAPAADIAYAPGKEGRAGWSWYTGAAGWYVRLVRELYGGAP